jgi:hypothetical protein
MLLKPLIYADFLACSCSLFLRVARSVVSKVMSVSLRSLVRSLPFFGTLRPSKGGIRFMRGSAVVWSRTFRYGFCYVPVNLSRVQQSRAALVRRRY